MAAMALTIAVLVGDSAGFGFGLSHTNTGTSAIAAKSINACRRPRPRLQPLLLASAGGAKDGNGTSGDIDNGSSMVTSLRLSPTTLSKEKRRQQSRSLSNARAICPSCHRPPSSCVCAALPPDGEKITLPHVDVLILQHPTEFRRKHVSTVPLIPLVLDGVKITVGRAFDHTCVQSILDDAEAKGQTPLLLFPGPDAITLDDSRALEHLQSRSERLRYVRRNESETDGNFGATSTPINPSRKFLLILIDGTWTQAGSMVRKSSPLLLERCLPIQFLSTEKTQQSLYHSMRKQPDAHCLSTLEACARTLPLLEKLAAESSKEHRNDASPDELGKSGTSLANDAVRHLHAALEILVQTQLEYEKESILANRSKVRDPGKLQAKWSR